jgi:hypothetical protein
MNHPKNVVGITLYGMIVILSFTKRAVVVIVEGSLVDVIVFVLNRVWSEDELTVILT